MTHLLLAIIYLAFISLGLPDGLLGAGWPSMYLDLSVPVSYAGAVSMIIAMGTVVSSLASDKLTRRFGAGKITAVSVAMTAAALFGFSMSRSFWMLCVWAVPYGLGAGSVDAALNNYVALHYASRHMSWLHCMWGVGASVGPYVMGWALTGGHGWRMGYWTIGILQIVLTAVLLVSLPLWKKPVRTQEEGEGQGGAPPLTLKQTVKLPGVKAVMAAFFCYCSLEQTAGLWASSYLVLHSGMAPEKAAGYGSLFFLGVTVGRAASGFLTVKLRDRQMIRLGHGITALGVAILFLPMGDAVAVAGLLLIGLGCAPVYPCLIHGTPACFGADHSQAVIGLQMASAYVGTCLIPPLFGLIARHISAALLPGYLLVFLGLMVLFHECMLRRAAR